MTPHTPRTPRKPLDIALVASALLLALATVATAAGIGHRPSQPAQPRSIQPESAQPEDRAALQTEARFQTLDIIIDAGNANLAAYQFELSLPEGATLVGVENGEHRAFASTPHYDPAALGNNRIIVAAYSTDARLPTGTTRVCTLRIKETSEANPTTNPVANPIANYTITLILAADKDGNPIDASIAIAANPEE